MQIVRLTVPADEAELAADALWAAKPTAVSEVDDGDGRITLTADVTAFEALGGAWPFERVEVDSGAFLDTWRDWARPEPAGEGFVLVPAWMPDAAQGIGGRRPVYLDPGRTFGSGSHPTTRRCVAIVEGLTNPGDLVLDVGCGSGVLSVVTALLGADVVVAIDIDPAAIEATRENAERNAVSDQVRASTTPIDEIAFRFDLVVANIGLRVLVEHAKVIARTIAPGGHLVLAGLLDSQLDETLAAYPGLTELERTSDEGWATATLSRPLPRLST